jgi:predicted transcriptional regulator
MIKHTDNPAGRLFLILKKARSINKQSKMRTAWAEILEVDPKDTTELLRKIGKVNQLPFDIKDRIKSINNEDHELYLRKLNKVEQALGKLNFNSRWDGFLNIIDDTTVSSLEFISNLLAKENYEKGLSKKEIDELLDLTQKFKKELIDSNIPEAVKKFILERLNAIESAIHDYKISGIKPIEIEIERSVGSLFMKRGIYNKEPKWGKKFINFIIKIAPFISFVNDGQTLIGDAIKLLSK